MTDLIRIALCCLLALPASASWGGGFGLVASSGPKRLPPNYRELRVPDSIGRLELRGGGSPLHEQRVDLGYNNNVHVVAHAGEVTFTPSREGLELRWAIAMGSTDGYVNPKTSGGGSLEKMIPIDSIDEKSKGIRTAFPPNKGSLSLNTRSCMLASHSIP